MIKWRYYFKEGGEIISSDEAPQVPKEVTKISFVALSYGIDDNERVKSIRDFFASQDCLVRVPVFYDAEGNETEVQNKDYQLYKPEDAAYMMALAPKQGAEIILSSIRDGFDIMPLRGGAGFCEHIPYVLNYVAENPQEFIGKEKIKLFGYSNNSVSIMLKDLLQYVHTHTATSIFLEMSKDTPTKDILDSFAVIKGDRETVFSREAIPYNEASKDLCSRDSYDHEITCYPFNISTFFWYFANSIWPFIPPKEDYSLMLETINWHNFSRVKQVLHPLREFLQDLKNRQQKLPMMIELADITPSNFIGPASVYEHGRLLSPSEVEKKFQRAEKYNAFMDLLAKVLKKDKQEISDEEAEKYIKEKVDIFYEAYLKEISEIADDFGIALFIGGKKRIGHGCHNPVQPSDSRNKITLQEDEHGKKFVIQTEINALETRITEENIEKLSASKRAVEHCAIEPQEEACLQESKLLKLHLLPMNESAQKYEIEEVRSLKASNHYSLSRMNFDEDARCYVVHHAPLTYSALEMLFLMGRLGATDCIEEKFAHDSPPIIFTIAQCEEETDEEKFKKQYEEAQSIVRKFCDYHQVKVPIFLTVQPVNTREDFPFLAEDGVTTEKIFQLSAQLTKVVAQNPSPNFSIHGGAAAASASQQYQKR